MSSFSGIMSSWSFNFFVSIISTSIGNRLNGFGCFGSDNGLLDKDGLLDLNSVGEEEDKFELIEEDNDDLLS